MPLFGGSIINPARTRTSGSSWLSRNLPAPMAPYMPHTYATGRLAEREPGRKPFELAKQSGDSRTYFRMNALTREVCGIIGARGIAKTLTSPFESYLYPGRDDTPRDDVAPEVSSGQHGAANGHLETSGDAERNHCRTPPREPSVRTSDQIVGYTASGRYIGMTLAEAAKSESKPWEEFAYDLMIEENGVETFIFPWQSPREEFQATLDRTAGATPE